MGQNIRHFNDLEWPTAVMLAACYCLWLVSGMAVYPSFPTLALALMAVAAALHSSLQHEALHGHPTRDAGVNEFLVSLPLAVVYPYRRFKQMHLRHHNDERLTDPYDDPESWFRSAQTWGRTAAPLRFLLRVNNTFAGRLILGPPLMAIGFLANEPKKLFDNERDVRRAWLHHIGGLVVLFSIVSGAMGIDPLLYVATVAYGGMALISIRTYCEHRWENDADGRTVIVERGGFFGLLFLYNNLHVVHHALPRAPWYALPGLYRAERAEWQRRNGGYVFSDYWAIVRAYAFRAKDPVVHPAWRTGGTSAPVAGGSFHPVRAPISPQIGCNAVAPAKPEND